VIFSIIVPSPAALRWQHRQHNGPVICLEQQISISARGAAQQSWETER